MSLDDSKIVAAYRERTARSAQLAARARETFPSGVTHDGRFLRPYPIYVDRAEGARKWDVDGNEYVDYCGGHGALLLGHSHPQVTAAVTEQLQRGTHFGACHELEIRWGELVKQLIPCAETVRFTSSGTEATLLALRLARAHTGRLKLMHFQGHFHGWHDHVAFGVNSHFDGTPTPGVLPGVAESVVMAPPQDIEGTRRLIDEHPDLAAAIIEPTGASWGQVPVTPQFLEALREMTAERGIVLIFDEVISGFRCSPGGAQAAYGITPDMTTLAKIIAGGFPGGALVGKRELMQPLSFPEEGEEREKIAHHGTYNANPVSAAAGIAALEIVAETDACDRASDYAARLRAALSDVLARESVPWIVYGTFSGFHILVDPQDPSINAADIEAGKYDYRTFKLRRDPELITRLRLAMMCHGVEIFPWPGGPTSAAHTDAELSRTADAFQASLRMLKEEGAIRDKPRVAEPSASS